jgi:VanZ family protein
MAAAIALLYGVTDEYHQSFVEGRNGTPVDVGIDAIGISLAILAVRARVRRLRERRIPDREEGRRRDRAVARAET